jgi:hypothetical protein
MQCIEAEIISLAFILNIYLNEKILKQAFRFSGGRNLIICTIFVPQSFVCKQPCKMVVNGPIGINIKFAHGI